MKHPALAKLFGANLIILLIFSGAFTVCYGQVDLNKGLVAYYPFNGNANDASGNNLNPVNVSGVTPATDRFGNANKAFQFYGNSHIVIKDNGKLSSGKFTITYYFYTEETSTQIAIGKINYLNGNGAGYNTGVYSNIGFNAYFNVIDKNSPCDQQITSTMVYTNFSSITIKPLTWYCMVCVFEDGIQSIYINGVMVGRRTQNFKTAKYCENTDFIIGSWWSGDPNGFKGKLDEIRYYNRALNEQEINSFCETVPMVLCDGVQGKPIVNIDFGKGTGDQKPIQELVDGAQTSLKFQPVSGNPSFPAPIDGQYTITDNIPLNSNWYSGKEDHTPGDVSGNMLFINSSTKAEEFYKQTISGLCGETTYEFAAWVSNALNPYLLDGIEPDLKFIIEDKNGNTLGSYTTGGIPQNIDYGWKQYGFLFNTPSAIDQVVLKIINNRVGSVNFTGNDFAIDDITFTSCNPLVQASFEKEEMVDSMVICAGSPVNLYMQMPKSNNNSIQYWQYSDDNGSSWINPNPRMLGDQKFNLPDNPTNTSYLFRIVSITQESNDNIFCQGFSNVIKVISHPAPLGKINSNDICQGENVIIQFDAQKGYAPFTVEYTDGNSIYTKMNVANVDSFQMQGLNKKTVSFTLLKITDANGCMNKEDLSQNPKTISIHPLPDIQFTEPSSFCNSITGMQKLEAQESSGLRGTGRFIGQGISEDGSFQPSSLSIGEHAITFSFISDKGCSASETKTFAIQPSPQVNLGPDLSLCKGFQKELNAGTGDQFNWQPFIGLSNPNIANPVVTVEQDIEYIVTVTEVNGCTASDTIAIKAIPNNMGYFNLPNAFSPNGDGKNDCFGIQHWGEAKIKEFSIFNRWGQKVFTTKNPSQCWDGNTNGHRADAGTYVYKIEAVTSCGEVSRQGTVNIIK